jgi:hypothetical protein
VRDFDQLQLMSQKEPVASDQLAAQKCFRPVHWQLTPDRFDVVSRQPT